MKKIAAVLLPCLAVALLSSCASVSVKGENRTSKQPASKPTKIYIADFGTQQGTFNIAGKESKDPETFKKKTSATLANYIVKTVNTHVAPAEPRSKFVGQPTSGWLVAGEFVRVNTGSRVLRAGVGLGAGGTKMETRVQVYDLSARGAQPFLTFETTGGSNAMPGLLTNPGTSAAISMTTQAMMGVTDDCARTSRMIAGALNSYMLERGWIDKKQAYSVKRLGKYQLVHEQYYRMGN